MIQDQASTAIPFVAVEQPVTRRGTFTVTVEIETFAKEADQPSAELVVEALNAYARGQQVYVRNAHGFRTAVKVTAVTL
jgi:hypothetical protein